MSLMSRNKDMLENNVLENVEKKGKDDVEDKIERKMSDKGV